MSSFGWTRRLLASALLGILTSACAGHDTALPLQNAGNAVPALSLLAGPRPCKGQKKEGSDNVVSEAVSVHGGSLCIPEIDGLGGALEYPNVSPSTKATVTATIKDDHFPYPPNQPNAKAVLYIEVATSTVITFGTKLRAGAGVSGKGIKPNSTYTAYSAYNDFGLWRQPGGESSCYAVAKAGKDGGVLGLGSLLAGQSIGQGVSSGTPFLIEIFPGQQSGTTTAC